MNGTFIGVDLGGTKFQAGRIDFSSQDERTVALIESKKVSVHADMDASTLLDQLIECIRAVWTEEVQAIGVGVPGLVDHVQGRIMDIQNLPAWKSVPLANLLEGHFKRPVALDNDVNCFALGTHRFGAGKGARHMVAMSLGTGLGCGLVLNDTLYRGMLSGAGEVGMLPYKDGIIESYAGSFLFSRSYNSTGKAMHALAREADAQAMEAFAEIRSSFGGSCPDRALCLRPTDHCDGRITERGFRPVFWRYDRVFTGLPISGST